MSTRTRIRTTALRVTGILLVTAALLVDGPGAGVPVIAHGYVAESSPADGDVLSEGPAEVRVVFTEPFEPSVSSLTLVDSAGQEVPGSL
ncbi:MAG TPA: copper resistance protein CopC, partial [Bacillota bacterium]